MKRSKRPRPRPLRSRRDAPAEEVVGAEAIGDGESARRAAQLVGSVVGRVFGRGRTSQLSLRACSVRMDDAAAARCRSTSSAATVFEASPIPSRGSVRRCLNRGSVSSDAKSPCRSDKCEYAGILLLPACVPGAEEAARLVGCVRELESARRRAAAVFAAAHVLVHRRFSRASGSMWHDGVALARPTGPTCQPLHATTHLEAKSLRKTSPKPPAGPPGSIT